MVVHVQTTMSFHWTFCFLFFFFYVMIFPSQTIPANFNYGHIYHYLLESVVLLGQDGKKEDTDLSHMTSKSLTKGEQYVKSDSIAGFMDTCRNGNYYLKGKGTCTDDDELSLDLLFSFFSSFMLCHFPWSTLTSISPNLPA
jgi:hypothetical protein